MKVLLHGMERASRANGPGLRAVLWFQGCTTGCPGCFNPDTHEPSAGYQADTVDIASTLIGAQAEIEGVSISGGEPFQQPEALLDLVERAQAAGLSVLVFSGYPIDVIKAQPLGPALLSRIDVLIAGPYVTGKHVGRKLLGSSNQRVHLLSTRYVARDLADVPATEVVLHRDGTMTLTGIRPVDAHSLGSDSRS